MLADITLEFSAIDNIQTYSMHADIIIIIIDIKSKKSNVKVN